MSFPIAGLGEFSRRLSASGLPMDIESGGVGAATRGGLGSIVGGASKLLGKISPIGAAGAALGVVTGLGQMLFSGRKKAERELRELKMPTYRRDKGVLDYYEQAKARANENLLNSPLYLQAKTNADRMAATVLNSMQDRRSALGSVGRVAAAQQEGLNQAAVKAQSEQNRRFSELAGATRMQQAENRMAFDINEMQPFQRKDMLARQKLAAANARFDAGLQNISNAATLGIMSGKQ